MRHPRTRRRPLFGLLASAAISALAAGAAHAELPQGTEHALSSVAELASNLRLTNVPHPIDVRADSLRFDYGAGRLDYSGNVQVEHGGVTIRADELSVAFTPGAERRLDRITARGKVQVRRADESAFGGLAVYDPGAATIVLSDNARLGSGPNLLPGERVVVYLDEGRATVEGDGSGAGDGAASDSPGEEASRVRVVIMPETISDSGDGAEGILSP